MQQVNSYLYDNTVNVLYDIDPSVEQRNRVVYTRTINIYKGIDNLVKIKVLNNDQKPVNVTGYTLTFNMIDDYVNANATVVLSANVIISNANLGIGTVTLSSLDLVQLDRDVYTYNVKVNNGSANIAAYVDDNYGAAGQIYVSSTAYPVGDPDSLDLGQTADGITSATFDFGNI
tara:strand:+ start:2481 stop:3002 length:522 start_codon:yes stop_codon:yes gene_type:complete